MEQAYFHHIKEQADIASQDLANERGPCLDAAECGMNERFSNKTAIAPTASISIICGGTSPGIEPIAGNSFTIKPCRVRLMCAIVTSINCSMKKVRIMMMSGRPL